MGALATTKLRATTAPLPWTDPPYHWHVNDGEEVFAVLDGRVEMRFKENGQERSVILETGDVFFATVGTEHVARPIGEARILAVETEGKRLTREGDGSPAGVRSAGGASALGGEPRGAFLKRGRPESL